MSDTNDGTSKALAKTEKTEKKSVSVQRVKGSTVSIAEKQKVEALLTRRSQSLFDYIRSLESTTEAVTESAILGKSREIAELEAGIATLDVDIDERRNREQTDIEVCCRVLAEQHGTVIDAVTKEIELLKKQLAEKQEELDKLLRTHKEEIKLAKDEVVRRHDRANSASARKKEELSKKLRDAKQTKESELNLIRQVFRGHLNSISAAITDRLHQATECLWTSVNDTDGLAACLTMIPDLVTFRQFVTEEKICEVLITALDTKSSEINFSCKNCKQPGVILGRNGSVVCKKCNYTNYDTSHVGLIIKKLQLPNFVDLVTSNTRQLNGSVSTTGSQA